MILPLVCIVAIPLLTPGQQMPQTVDEGVFAAYDMRRLSGTDLVTALRNDPPALIYVGNRPFAATQQRVGICDEPVIP